MASGSRSPITSSIEEVRAALMKAQADLKASHERNKKLTTDLRRELKSVKSSHKSHHRISIPNPRIINFTEEAIEGEDHSDKETEEEAPPSLGQM